MKKEDNKDYKILDKKLNIRTLFKDEDTDAGDTDILENKDVLYNDKNKYFDKERKEKNKEK